MTENLQPIVERIQKLLALASKNSNEHEAAQAARKAQELLEEYNLDMATIERAGKGGTGAGRREDLKQRGGMYTYQRDLWNSVAQLNFCLYFQTREQHIRRRNSEGVPTKVRWSRAHRVVGRVVNVRATTTMCEYLEGTIERLCRENVQGSQAQFFSNWAVSFRKGMADRIVRRVYERRDQRLSEEAAAKEAAAAAAGPQSTSRALSLSVYIDEETDANMDFLHGEGYSAKRAARQAQRAEERRLEEERYTKWAAENPEEARRLAEEQEKEAAAWKPSGRGSRGGGGRRDNTDWGAYRAGSDAGASVSIDPQVGSGSDQRRLK